MSELISPDKLKRLCELYYKEGYEDGQKACLDAITKLQEFILQTIKEEKG